MKEKESPKIKILPITEFEKVVLKNRILKSVDVIPKKRKRNNLIIGTAVVCVCMLLGVGFFVLNTPETSITKYVNESSNVDVNESEEVVLILSEGETLSVNEDALEINYSNSGENITVGEDTQIEQETKKNNKTIYNTLLVPYGKRTKIKLSDGSLVWLNSGSKIVYPAVFNDNKREVYLEGEAIFDVAHNKSKPFIVMSENQEIQVLGTVFCVTSYKDDNKISTVLKSGSVRISYKDNLNAAAYSQKIKITPGTKASFNKKAKSIVSEKVNVENYFSWRDGILIFKNNNLKYITKKISRYYNIEVEILDEDLANETFSGYLDLNENIESVLQNIKASTDMNYTNKNNKIIINQN